MRRWTTVTVTALVVTLSLAVVAQVSTAGAHGQAATPGTHYITLAGTDFRGTDNRTILQFASNTGGGVYVEAFPTDVGYVEDSVTLPDGASVTEVTFYMRNCESAPIDTNFLYFGAYTPSSGAFDYIIPEFNVPMGACNQTQAIVRPVNPAVTVDNSLRRYVVGVYPKISYVFAAYDTSNVKQLIVGARVAYSMPGAFLPVIQR